MAPPAEQRVTTSLTPELACSDLAASLVFYVDLLGFAIPYRRPEDGFAMLERQGSRIMLDEIRATSVTGTDRTWLIGPLEKPYGRGINLQIETNAIDDLYGRVQAAGAPLFLAMEEKWYRVDHRYVGNRQFIVQDPDGYLLRFFEDLGARLDPGDAASAVAP